MNRNISLASFRPQLEIPGVLHCMLAFVNHILSSIPANCQQRLEVTFNLIEPLETLRFAMWQLPGDSLDEFRKQNVSSRLELERYRAAAFQSFQEMCHCIMWILGICIQSAIVGQSQEHEEINLKHWLDDSALFQNGLEHWNGAFSLHDIMVENESAIALSDEVLAFDSFLNFLWDSIKANRKANIEKAT